MSLRRTGVALPLVTLFLLAGCLGSASPVQVAPEAIASGWSHTVEDEHQSVAADQVDLIINKYEHSGALQGEIYLIAVTKVPFVNEEKQIREQVTDQAAKSDVQMERSDRFARTLDNGHVVDVTEYRITKQVSGITASGYAWFMTWEASGFVAGGIGWATTEHATLLGTQTDKSVWNETQTMLLASEW